MPIGYLSRISHTFIYELNPFRPLEESDWIVRSPCFLPSLNASEVSTLSLLKPVHLLGREAYHLYVDVYLHSEAFVHIHIDIRAL